MKWLFGIDEAGRGPIAGPVAVGVCLIDSKKLQRTIARGIQTTGFALKDSKKLSRLAREAWYRWMKEQQKAGALYFSVGFSSAQKIDAIGIVPAICSAMDRALKTVSMRADVSEKDLQKSEVRLDGALRAPIRFKHQKTIIKGDELEPIISLASIAAKVERDALMRRTAKKYPAYLFEAHVGYGTKAHYKAIGVFGITTLHRKSFLTRFGGKYK